MSQWTNTSTQSKNFYYSITITKKHFYVLLLPRRYYFYFQKYCYAQIISSCAYKLQQSVVAPCFNYVVSNVASPENLFLLLCHVLLQAHLIRFNVPNPKLDVIYSYLWSEYSIFTTLLLMNVIAENLIQMDNIIAAILLFITFFKTRGNIFCTSYACIIFRHQKGIK